MRQDTLRGHRRGANHANRLPRYANQLYPRRCWQTREMRRVTLFCLDRHASVELDRAIGVLDGNWRRARMISEDNLATRFRASIGIVLLMMGQKKEGLLHLKASEKEALEQQNLRALYFAQKGIAYYLFLEGCIKESYDKTFDFIQNATSAKTISRQYTWPWLLDMLFDN